MPEPGEHRTREGFTRLITFADAVVAIALTLLVLPLTDLAGEEIDEDNFAEFINDHYPVVLSFAISFAVIWVLWRNHHRMFEHFVAYDNALMRFHFVWLATIVVLPFATALLDNTDLKWANAFYIVVLGVSIGSLMAMARWGINHPELLDDDPDTLIWRQQRGGYGSLIALTAALIISLVMTSAGSWPLLLLLASAPLDKVITRWSKPNAT